MNTLIVYCTCGLWHDIKELEGLMIFNDGIPEFINCDECPICNGDDDPEDDVNGEEIEE